MVKWFMTGNRWFLTAVGIGVIALAALLFFLVSCRGSNENIAYVYHFNPSAQRLEAEVRQMPAEGSLIEATVRFMHSGPVSGALISTWPYEFAPYPEDLFLAIMPEGSMLLAFIKPVFYEIPPLAQSLFKGALVHTMESLVERAFPHITEIKILVTDNHHHAFDILMLSLTAEEGDEIPDVPWLIYDGTFSISNDPSLSRALITPLTFNNLHFVDETGTGLIVKTHESDEVDFHTEERIRYALLLLINDFRPEGAMFPIPTETAIHDVILDQNDIFINFSADFMSRFVGGRNLAELMIYSIVNTLTIEFTAPHRVHFLIDEQQYESFHGVEYFDQPFERDDTFLLSYIQEREQQPWGEWEPQE